MAACRLTSARGGGGGGGMSCEGVEEGGKVGEKTVYTLSLCTFLCSGASCK
jgi:hypothetical protein